MKYNNLGKTGLRVSEFCFGTATFGGTKGFEGFGNTQVKDAHNLIKLCIDSGINLIDTADLYSRGESETILGKAIDGMRNDLLISTKTTFPMGDDVNDYGSSRYRIIKACENSLKRLNTDYIDIYHMHGFDGNTDIEETLRALDDLVTSGKVRYIACSNFSGWHLMKSLAISDKYGWSKYVSHQVYYSLFNRDYEWELMPLGIDQNVGSMIWSPLASGLLSGKFHRNAPIPKDSRVGAGSSTVPFDATDEDRLYDIVEELMKISGEIGKPIPQIALNWLLKRPTVDTVIIGARNEQQLKQNLEAASWSLTDEHVKRLEDVSKARKAYPYWHQEQNPQLKSQLFI